MDTTIFTILPHLIFIIDMSYRGESIS